MKLCKLGAFTSDLPDDQIENEAGDEIIQFGGQGVSRVIAEALRADGYRVQEPIHLEHLGWEFNVSADQTLGLRLSDLGRFFTLQSMAGSFWFLHTVSQSFQATVLRKVTEALRKDGRFHDLLWFDAIGEAYGFTDPIADAPGNQKLRPPPAWDWSSWKE